MYGNSLGIYTYKIKHYGKIPGIPTGSWWSYRVNLSESGVHRPPVGGMHGRATGILDSHREITIRWMLLDCIVRRL